MKRLNGWDAMLLYSETPNVHMHTLKIGVIDAADFDGEFTFEEFRQHPATAGCTSWSRSATSSSTSR